jgi:hypothetical protein
MKTYSGILKLVCLVVIAPLFIWIFALKDTYDLYKETCKMKLENQSISLITLKKQDRTVTKIPSKPFLSNGKILQILEDSLSNLQIEVSNYTPELIDSEGECKLYLGKLVLAGRYIELVKMISIVEQVRLPVKMVSLNFSYDRKKRKPSSFISLVMLLEQMEY